MIFHSIHDLRLEERRKQRILDYKWKYGKWGNDTLNIDKSIKENKSIEDYLIKKTKLNIH